MRYTKLVVLAALPFLAGCYPIGLDVSKDGRILIPCKEGFFTLDPAEGKLVKVNCNAELAGDPVVGRFSPDGKTLLVVTGDDNLGYRFYPVNLADGKGQEVYQSNFFPYARFSPDGRSLASVPWADKKVAPMDWGMPELTLLPMQPGQAPNPLAPNVGQQFRWFPDSKRLLVLQTKKAEDLPEKKGDQSKRGNNQGRCKGEYFRYWSQLVVLDVATKKTEPLAEVYGPLLTSFDLSPDGQKVVLTALAAGAPNAELKERPAAATAQLYEVDLATGKVRAVDKKAECALWSPDGKRVLLACMAPDGKYSLEVADAGLTKFERLEGVVCEEQDINYEPSFGWLNAQTVFHVVRPEGDRNKPTTIKYETVTLGPRGQKRIEKQVVVGAKAEK